MAAKTYRCTNFANCDRALNKELIEIQEGTEPDCSHSDCRKHLVEEPSGDRQIDWKKIAAIGAAALLLSGVGYVSWLYSHPKQPNSVTVTSVAPPLIRTCDTNLMEEAYKSGDCAAVVKLGDECLAKTPNDTTALSNIATCLLRSGEPARSKNLLQRALAIKPNDPYLHYNQACVEARVGNREEALGHLKRACHFGLAPATFIQDPDLATLKGYGPFERLLATKNCDE